MSIDIISRIVFGVFLSMQCFWDLRYKEIPTQISLLGGIIGVFLSIWSGRNWMEMVLALIPGIIFLLFAKMSKEAVGFGDGILLCAMSGFYSIGSMMFICTTAFFAVSVLALFLLVVCRKNRNYEMPFVPFLLGGWIVEFLVIGGGV